MRFTTIATTVCIIALLSASIAPRARAVDLGNIMPMGDSITYGQTVAGGYRLPLYNLLTAAGDKFSFVGSSTDNAASVLTTAGQAHHEGHPSYIINGGISDAPHAGLDENLASWIGPSGAAPDRILLMIGVNDIGYGYNLDSAPTRLSNLIGDIYRYRPNVSLYVASLIPLANSTQNSLVQTYNAAIPGIVATYAAKGKSIHYVDMYDALTTSMLNDGVHPNAAGYAAMAQVWSNALTPRQTPEPSSIVLVGIGLAGLLTYTWKKRTRTQI
jgi:lysophospholipase L1-like esterase